MNNKIDIVVVSRSEEMDLLRIQARSIVEFVEPELINKYIVIWNDDGDIEEVRRVLLVDNPVLHGQLSVLPYTMFVPDTTKYTGWRVQQVLKLVIARVSEAPFMYVLDTKNHFLRPVTTQGLFAESGAPFVHSLDYAGSPFEEHLKQCLDYFKVPRKESLVGLPTVTPFVLYRDAVRQMIATIEAREAKPFEQCFLDMGFFKTATEFLLYNAFSQTEAGSQHPYVEGEKPYFTLFKSTVKMTEQKSRARLRALEEERCKVFGLHPGRFGTLRKGEIELILEAWDRAGLLPFARSTGIVERF